MKKKKIQLEVINVISNRADAVAYNLLLQEVEGLRSLTISIGPAEAQTLLILLNGIEPPRPLTHHLFVSCLEVLGVHMVRTLIYKVEKGVFYAYIYLKVNETLIRMDARTSDAISMALKMKAPIFVYEEILNAESLRESKPNDSTSPSGDISIGSSLNPDSDDFFREDTIEILQKALQKAIKEENYERAAHIRDEINKRKTSY